MRKIHVIMRGVDLDVWKACSGNPKVQDIKIVYCGYIEVANKRDVATNDRVWDLCNWSCWTRRRPKVCQHLLIDHCNDDMAFCDGSQWYSHDPEAFTCLHECWKEMTSEHYTEHFAALWPIRSQSIVVKDEQELLDLINNNNK